MSRKRAWKAGDRVAVYGYDPTGSELNHFYGTVKAANADGWLIVRWDCKDWHDRVQRVHSKQCRRLVPRKRREWEGYWDKAAVIVPDQIVFIPLGTKPNTPARGTCATLIEAPKGRRR